VKYKYEGDRGRQEEERKEKDWKGQERIGKGRKG
jgi:hypothetical protein